MVITSVIPVEIHIYDAFIWTEALRHCRGVQCQLLVLEEAVEI
jgi:hypothetical protein